MEDFVKIEEDKITTEYTVDEHGNSIKRFYLDVSELSKEKQQELFDKIKEKLRNKEKTV